MFCSVATRIRPIRFFLPPKCQNKPAQVNWKDRSGLPKPIFFPPFVALWSENLFTAQASLQVHIKGAQNDNAKNKTNDVCFPEHSINSAKVLLLFTNFYFHFIFMSLYFILFLFIYLFFHTSTESRRVNIFRNTKTGQANVQNRKRVQLPAGTPINTRS